MERVAVVTGANRGIGLEVARQLARKGVRVVLTARDVRRGETARERLVANGHDVAFHPLEVSSADQAFALARWVADEYGRLDILVNNAGILADPRGSRMLTLDPALLRATMETNLVGPLIVTQALVPLMEKNSDGRIVNMSSGLGQLADMGIGTPAYRMSKTALNAFTRILAKELTPLGIKVNAMCPGWVRTDLGGPTAPKSVEDAADTAVWLATLPDDGPTGGFFRDRQAIDW